MRPPSSPRQASELGLPVGGSAELALGVPPTVASLTDRKHRVLFAVGCSLVVLGVVLHLPMYWMGRGDGFRLAGMEMDAAMGWGMAAIVVGILLAAWGLLPASHWKAPRLQVDVPTEAPLGRAHYLLMVVLVAALVIDVMKPASLGFVLPGMRAEYALATRSVAWLPFAALCGTVLGSLLWGALADVFGRRASMLLSAVMFVGTSICGAMPSYLWNVVMCFLMGVAAGGMLPVTYALVAETMPARHRGWVLVVVGGVGSVGGYLAASLAAAWLEPAWSWRALWFMNLPTGASLIALSKLIPESPHFLLRLGLVEQARATLARFGSQLHEAASTSAHHDKTHAADEAVSRGIFGMTLALSAAGLAWGLINFGVLLWLPAHFVALGQSLPSVSALLAASAVIALPTVLAAAWLYGRRSSKGAILLALAFSIAALVAVVEVQARAGGQAAWLVTLALLIVGSNALLAMLLPYAAESYPTAVRGRAVGWVAACTKVGGPVAQGLALLGLSPELGAATVLTALVTLGALALVAFFCVETRTHGRPALA